MAPSASSRTSEGERAPLRLLCLLPTLAGGGAERVMTHLLRHLDRRRFSPTLLLCAREGPLLPLVPADVPLLDLGKRHPWDLPRLVRQTARIMRRGAFAAIVSFLDYGNLVALLAHRRARCRAPLCVSERVHTASLLGGSPWGRLYARLYRRLYPRADHVVAVSRGIARELAEQVGVAPGRLSVIPNPVDLALIARRQREALGVSLPPGAGPLLCAAGRLAPQKGFDDLLAALVRVRERVPARLVILGEGPERAALERRVRALGLAGAVSLPGFCENPYAVMARADLFVLSSRFEGFPNALVEAMACGVPVVSTSCPTGPEEIVTGGREGLLVPVGEPAALAAAIVAVLERPAWRAELGRAGRERAGAFAVARIVERYGALFERLVDRTGPDGRSGAEEEGAWAGSS